MTIGFGNIIIIKHSNGWLSIYGYCDKITVKVKDKVIYNKYGATNFKIDEQEYVILRQSDILGVFEGDDN